MLYYEKWIQKGIIIFVVCFVFYLVSLYFAYNKGYQKHVLEVAKESAQIIIDSRNDVVEAIEVANNVEKDIIKSDECSAVFSFDLRTNCLSK